jgi:hypothetical protein
MSVVSCTSTPTSNAKRLAGESPGYDVDRSDTVVSQSFGGNAVDVVIARHSRPMRRQHTPAEGVTLNEGDSREAGHLRSQVHATDPGK